MKTDTIKLSQLDNTLKLVELQRDLVVRLTLFKEGQELQKKRLNEINIVTKSLRLIKNQTPKSLFKLEEDTRKEINKLLKDRSLYL